MASGRYPEVMRHLGSTVLSVLHLIGLDSFRAVDATFVRAYAASFPDPAACLGAIEFPLDMHHGRIRDYVRAGATGVPAIRTKPAMLVEGLRDRAIPPALAMADFRGLWPSGPVHELPTAGHYCQEDAPAEIVALIGRFLDATAA